MAKEENILTSILYRRLEQHNHLHVANDIWNAVRNLFFEPEKTRLLYEKEEQTTEQTVILISI